MREYTRLSRSRHILLTLHIFMDGVNSYCFIDDALTQTARGPSGGDGDGDTQSGAKYNCCKKGKKVMQILMYVEGMTDTKARMVFDDIHLC